MGERVLKADPVPLFAALGDRTRLIIVTTLADGEAHSISELASGFGMSRQAVTKHLKVLEKAGLVANDRAGRESRYRLEGENLDTARDYLDRVSAYWDTAIGRLREFVEEED
ncbi:helix-turn-helix transcriptional regulator [Henriciella sp.]|uniref:ArsR/SmtB family transcription factor n=1 Tax=Henriciella sp. TaxID=1968823 RepID=UPI00260C37E8|nr:metalloregulator ArsR/SmtB family transcription factor [Henriciella sp.]